MKPNIIPNVPFAEAVCYSGYREGQSPGDEIFPTADQVQEDLHILAARWRYLRLYDCSRHAELVLEAIRRDGLDLKVMLGANMRAEVSNPDCPWGAEYDPRTLARYRDMNDAEIERMAELAGEYATEVFSLSVGNEATVDWTDHLVPVERLIRHVRRLKERVDQPITFCENYVPWLDKLAPLVEELDFLSVHTYPVWEYRSIDEALDYSRENFFAVAARHPHKPVIITEAGWTTRSNGRGIEPGNASQELQARYFAELTAWTRSQRILTFVFEAFDEPWKGSPDPDEPEKHWGLFTVDRKAKLVMREAFPHLAPDENA